MLNIIVAIHGNENVDFNPYQNHLRFFAINARKYNFTIVTTRSVRIAHARNAILDKAKELVAEGFKCDYVFFLDTDHLVDERILDYLVQDMDKADCVSGLIHRRSKDFDTVGYMIDDKGVYQKISIVPGSSVYYVDTCAMGCTLVKWEVFEELGEDFMFRDETRISPKGKRFMMRSDHCFFEDLRLKGKKIMIDARVQVGHLGEPITVWPLTGDALKRQKKIMGFCHS